MADSHAFPSRDPADDGSVLGMVNTVLRKFLQGVDDCLPARVIAYNRTTNRALLVPMVKMLTTDGRKLNRAQVASVPVLQYGGGGFMLSFNLKPGDLGWIKACDRDISLIMQAYVDDGPNTLRMHTFEDSWFIPDVMRGYTIAAEDAENAVLQTLDGSVKVALWTDRLKMTAGALSMTMGPDKTTFIGDVEFADSIKVDGHSELVGGALIDGIEFTPHVHPGVVIGGDKTQGASNP